MNALVPCSKASYSNTLRLKEVTEYNIKWPELTKKNGLILLGFTKKLLSCQVAAWNNSITTVHDSALIQGIEVSFFRKCRKASSNMS